VRNPRGEMGSCIILEADNACAAHVDDAIVSACNFSNAAVIGPLATVWLAGRHAWLAGIVGVEYETESKWRYLYAKGYKLPMRPGDEDLLQAHGSPSP
jgi:hypothetical protein